MLDYINEQLAQAHINMLEAWRVQSQTTVEEGYSVEDANLAIAKAKAAEREYNRLADLREKEIVYEAEMEKYYAAEYQAMLDRNGGIPDEDAYEPEPDKFEFPLDMKPRNPEEGSIAYFNHWYA